METDFNPESRIVWEEHNEVKYIHLNFQHCSDEQRIEISKVATKIIEKEPFNSALLLLDLRNTTVSPDSMRKVSAEWNGIRPNIKRSAILGVTGIKAVLLKVWWSIAGRQARPFRSKVDALNYLISQV